GVSAASILRSAMTPPTSSVALSQPIIISDTPSPAISIITIHSDTDTEDERKFHPARLDEHTPLLQTPLFDLKNLTHTLSFSSVGLSRTNVISCVTVHDSDSSTASPLTPLPRNLNATGCLSSRQAKSLAVVAPSVKHQTSERSAASHGRVEIGEGCTSANVGRFLFQAFLMMLLSTFRYLHEAKKIIQQTALQFRRKYGSSWAGPKPVTPFKPQPVSHSNSSLHRQQTFPPTVSASHYSFPEVSALVPGSAAAAAAAAAASLYTYPASTALSSASQAMEQLLGRGHGSHGHSPSAYAATYASTSSSSRRDSASRKESVSSLLHGLPAAYQHQFAAGSPYVSVTPRAEAYSAYQLSPRRLTQYPYL
ncbi:hypothetical protein GOODEAATRI_006719, partial [Goodea atripinnis]